MTDDYEFALTTNREEVATLLSGLADGVAAGAVQLGPDGDGVTVQLPAELDLDLEFEEDDDEQGLGVELEWSTDDVDHTEVAESPDDREDVPPEAETVEPAVGAAARQVSLGRFELFEDRGGQWRWRLVHRNGDVVATSGEGYTRKHNARKGLRSVMRDAEGAEVTERQE